MAKVTVTDIQTKTSVNLTNEEAAIVASEIAIVEPGPIARLLSRLFPGPKQNSKIAPDFELVLEEGGCRTEFELLTGTVLQRKSDKKGFNFFLGLKVAEWHKAHSSVPSP